MIVLIGRLAILGGCIALSACTSPSRKYLGQTPTTLDVAGHRFDVYSDGQTAQAIRTNAAVFPGKEEVVAGAVVAVTAATGCDVRDGSVKGDVAIINMKLKCS